MMRRKDFALIARCFRMQLHMAASNVRRTEEIARMARFFALELETEHPTFNRILFMKACGLPEGESQ